MKQAVASRRAVVWIVLALVATGTLAASSGVRAEGGCVQDDAGSGRDAGFGGEPDPDPPVDIVPGDHSGCVDDSDYEDVYLLSVSAEDVVYIEATGSVCRAIFIWVFQGDETVGNHQPFGFDCEPARVGIRPATDGTLEIIIAAYAYDEPRVEYDFLVSINEVVPVCGVTQDDAGTGDDTGPGNAPALLSPTFGCVDLFDEEDHYTLDVEPGLRYHFALSTPDCSTYAIGVQYPDGEYKSGLGSRVCSDGQSRSDSFSEAMTITVSVHRWEGEGAYTLSYTTCTERLPEGLPRQGTSRLDGVQCAMDDLGL